MALEDDIKKVQQLNAEIKQLYRDLNRADRPPIFEPTQIQSAQDAIKGLKTQFNEINVELGYIASSFRDSVAEMSKQNSELGKTKSSLKSISSISTEIVYENKKGTLIEDKTLDKLQKRAKLQFESLKISILSGRLKGEDLKAARDAVNQEKLFFDQLKNIRNEQKEIKADSGVKLFSGLEDITSAIPGLRKLTGAFKEASEAAQMQGKFNLQNFGDVKGMSAEKRKQLKKEIAAEKKIRDTDLSTLQGGLEKDTLGKGMNADLIERLGLSDKLVGIDKKGNKVRLEGTAAAQKLKGLMKEGFDLTKDLKPLSKLPESITPLKAGLKALGPILKTALGPLALFAMLVETLLEADKATADLAKGMNMTYQEANALRGEFTSIANASGDIFVTTKGIQESFSFINTQLGSNVRLSGKLLTQFTKLREASGLTNEELYGATQLQLTSGKTLNEITGEIMAQAKLTSANNGVILNEKEILKDIKDVSAATTLSLGKNPAAIAEAVTQAKALGMTLGQVEKIAESLLNFESSITSELKAELLLGRDINLERARLLALNNDIAGVAREISSQIGNSADFAKMNVLQQNALAEAVGMNREELAKTLFVQENLGAATGKEAEKRKAILNSLVSEVGVEEARRRLGEQSIENLEHQAGIQDKFNQAVLKLKEVFVSMAPAILTIADMLTVVLDVVSAILIPFTLINSLFTAIGSSIKGLLPDLGIMGTIIKGIAAGVIVYAAYAAAGAVSTALGATIIGGIAAPVVAALTAATILTAGFSALNAATADDMISGTPGYGKRALYDEGELTLLNNKDTVIAGTDLFKPALANDMIAGNPQIIENTTIQPINQNQNSSLEVSQLKAENAAIKQETKKTNNLLESLITATKANKTVEMDDPFGALYTT